MKPRSQQPAGFATQTRTRIVSLMAACVAMAVIAASCGSDPKTTETASGDGNAYSAPSTAETTSTTSTTDSSADPDKASQAAAGGDAAATDIPDLDLVNVVSNETVNLRSLVPSDKPLLFWFWAPH